MKEFIYPRPERIIEYNILVLTKVKVKKADRSEVLSRRKLDAALESVQEHKGDLYNKAALLLQGLVKAHAFASGNRRTAFLATKDFITENNGTFAIQDDENNARVLQGVREGFYTSEDLVGWFKTGKIHEFKR